MNVCAQILRCLDQKKTWTFRSFMACCVATIEPNDVTDHVELFTLKRKKKKIKAVWSCLVTKRSRSNLSWKLKHLSNESLECTSKIKFSWLTTTNISRPAVRICINLNISFVYLHSIRSTSQPQSFHQVSFGSTWRWGCPHVFYAWGQDNRRAKWRLNTVKKRPL